MTVHRIAAAIRTAFTTLGRHQRNRVGSSTSTTRLRAVLANLAARVNSNRATAADYLANVLGADADFVRRYGSVFGKTATKLMRESGTEPTRNGLAVVIRHRHASLVEVNTYPVEVLAAAARAYGRTAALIGA